MAVDINLNVYQDEQHLACIHMFFGKALNSGSWSGWEWVDKQGMSVDGPWVLDDKNAIHGTVVTRNQLTEWIEEGYISRDVNGLDKSAAFLNNYPQSAIFRLWFLDWS